MVRSHIFADKEKEKQSLIDIAKWLLCSHSILRDCSSITYFKCFILANVRGSPSYSDNMSYQHKSLHYCELRTFLLLFLCSCINIVCRKIHIFNRIRFYSVIADIYLSVVESTLVTELISRLYWKLQDPCLWNLNSNFVCYCIHIYINSKEI